jgi:Putative prokaryotic signal transducing protein
MITVANCYDIHEAFRLQMALGAADIPSLIPDETTAQNVPYFFIGSSAGIRLQVAEEHASEAQRIISNAREVPDVPEVSNDEGSTQDEDEEEEEEEEEEQRF